MILKTIYVMLDIVLAAASLFTEAENLESENAKKEPGIVLASITFSIAFFLTLFMDEEERYQLCLFFTVICAGIAMLLVMMATTG